MLCFYLITWSVIISADVISAPDVISAQPRCQVGRAGLGPKLGPRPQKLPPGQNCHVTQIRLSDWSKFEILRSDWSVSYRCPILLWLIVTRTSESNLL